MTSEDVVLIEKESKTDGIGPSKGDDAALIEGEREGKTCLAQEPALTGSNNKGEWIQWKDSMVAAFPWIVSATEAEDDSSSQKALEKIRKSCGTKLVPYIDGFKSAKEAWSQLVIMHEHPWGIQMIGYTWCPILYRALWEGQQKESVKKLLDEYPDAVGARITPAWDTPLHIAALTGQEEIVKCLFDKMPNTNAAKEIVGRPNAYNETTLHIAAAGESTKMAKLILETNPGLFWKKNRSNRIPILVAAINGNKKMIKYLYPKFRQGRPEDERLKRDKEDEEAATLLTALIAADVFGFAIDLLNRSPELACTLDQTGETALNALAKRPTAFESGSKIGILDRFVRKCIGVKSTDREQGIKDYLEGSTTPVLQWLKGLVRRALKLICLQPLYHFIHHYISQIGRVKLMNEQTEKLTKSIVEKISSADFPSEVEGALRSALLLASEYGTFEIVREIMKACPHLILDTFDDDGCTVFHVAIIYSEEKVYNLLHELGPLKKHLASLADKNKNSMLHLAANMTPSRRLERVPCAAFQMQHELQWLKELESVVEPKWKRMKNREGDRPRVIFSKSHKDLIKDGKDWLIGMANSCMVMGTLVATVMFAAAFTVPGGNDSNGNPLFLWNNYFVVFAISDAVSLFTSISSVLMFLSIFTSRFAENDFLEDLPRKLVLGLFFLFIAVSTMMIAFGITLYMILCHRIVWITIPISMLASCPVVIYVVLQFPLFISVLKSTYFSTTFKKPKNRFKKKKNN